MKKQLTANELRQKFIDFFVSKDHVQISGASLIPRTILRCISPRSIHRWYYILGSDHPAAKLTKLSEVHPHGDIEAVGYPHHLTFFEMLANGPWALLQKEAIAYSFDPHQVADLDVSQLSVTVFAGEELVSRDEEAARNWVVSVFRAKHLLPSREDTVGACRETGLAVLTVRCSSHRRPSVDLLSPVMFVRQERRTWNDVSWGTRRTAMEPMWI
jgi:alanyl-tRNA synthetase